MGDVITSPQKECRMIKRMEKIFNPVTTRLAAGMAVTILLAACSTPASLPPKVAAGLKGLHTEGVSVKGQVEKTVGALKDLMSKPQKDYSPQFKRFSQEFDVLEAKVEKAVQQRTTTETVVEEQFLTWEENLKKLRDEELRARAGDRRAATEATYSEIQQSMAELRRVWGPFMSDLTDTRQYLKDDLTKEGIEIISPTAERIFKQKPTVMKRLDAAIEKLNKAIERN